MTISFKNYSPILKRNLIFFLLFCKEGPLILSGFPCGISSKKICLPVQEMQETQAPSLGREDPLDAEMATHSSTLAWSIPWTEDPGELQSMGSQRIEHDWASEHIAQLIVSLTIKMHKIHIFI